MRLSITLETVRIAVDSPKLPWQQAKDVVQLKLMLFLDSACRHSALAVYQE
jgi:hypothetical protein